MSLRITFELPVTEGTTWVVTSDPRGSVTVRTNDDARLAIATARWRNGRLDEKVIAKGPVSRTQWLQIENHLRTVERAAQARDLKKDGDHLNFVLEPGGDSPPILSSSPVHLTPGVWKIRVDRSGLVVITALEKDRHVIVATAHWEPGKLADKQIRNGAVSKQQWARVHAAIDTVKQGRVVAEKPEPASTPYVAFLLDLADGDDDRIVEGSLRAAPTTEGPTGAFVWKVAAGARGVVRIWSLGSEVVGSARWTGVLVDRQQRTPQLPTDYQWALVERSLVRAIEWRASEPTAIDSSIDVDGDTSEVVASPAPPNEDYRAFLFDIRDGSVVDGSIRFAPDPALVPERVFVWEVTRDGSTVRVEDWEGDRLATAIWNRGLCDTAQSGSLPTDAQWGLLRTALHDVTGLADEPERPAVADESQRAGERSPDRVRAATPSRTRRRNRILFPIAGALAVVWIVVLAFILRGSSDPAPRPPTPPPVAYVPTPSPPAPPPAPVTPMTKEQRIAASPDLAAAIAEVGSQPAMLAHYPVRWSELDVASTMTIEQVEKEPAEEVGKRLCVEGLLEQITRADVAGRRHYSAALKTAQGDRVELVIAGSAGTLVKRQPARACGVVLGATAGAATLYGMFDLPENRNPVVEKP